MSNDKKTASCQFWIRLKRVYFDFRDMPSWMVFVSFQHSHELHFTAMVYASYSNLLIMSSISLVLLTMQCVWTVTWKIVTQHPEKWWKKPERFWTLCLRCVKLSARAKDFRANSIAIDASLTSPSLSREVGGLRLLVRTAAHFLPKNWAEFTYYRAVRSADDIFRDGFSWNCFT